MNYKDATLTEVDNALREAHLAFLSYKNFSGKKKAEFLNAIAEEMEALGQELVKAAMEETSLPEARILNERGRTTGHCRMFANLVAEGEVLKFDGFLKVYLESTDDEEQEDEKGVLPPLRVGQVLPLNHMDATERFTRPPARYTEASLVKKLEELGIGRPSTFAPTIAKIMEEKRGYVVKMSKEGISILIRLVKPITKHTKVLTLISLAFCITIIIA